MANYLITADSIIRDFSIEPWRLVGVNSSDKAFNCVCISSSCRPGTCNEILFFLASLVFKQCSSSYGFWCGWRRTQCHPNHSTTHAWEGECTVCRFIKTITQEVPSVNVTHIACNVCFYTARQQSSFIIFLCQHNNYEILLFLITGSREHYWQG